MTKKSVTEILDECSNSHLKPELPANWTHLEHDVRNETLEEIASVLYALPLGSVSIADLVDWIRAQKSGPGGRHDL
jgi:hypothetical protein